MIQKLIRDIISTMDMEIMLKAVKSNRKLYNDAFSLFNTLKLLMNSLSGNISS